jgi:hypothetical protein
VIRATRIDGVARPTAVQLRGRIASPNAVTSPVTHRSVAVLDAFFFVRSGAGDELVHAVRLGDELVVETLGGRVHVPLQRVDVYYRGANPPGAPLPAIPAAFASLSADPGAHELARSGALRYRELALSSGQPVRLSGTVTPIDGRMAYREPYRADFAVVVEAERATLSADVVEHA